MGMLLQIIENWKTQVRKGYLELCILLLIQQNKRIYGFDLLDQLSKLGLPLKEGTLYPLLNRMTSDGVLSASWETENLKGHPRKFYSLTKDGTRLLTQMEDEFQEMIKIFKTLQK